MQVIVKKLGLIHMKNSIPTQQELFIAIINNNKTLKNLTLNDFTFEGNPIATKVTIIGKNNYKGKIGLFYEKDTRTNLNSIINNKNLDWFWFMSEKPTIAELLVKIKAKKSTCNYFIRNWFWY